jgi:hypothetical protein
MSECSQTTLGKHIFGLAKQQGELEELLERTLLESENNSVLLIGARGSGKSLLTEHVLSVARKKFRRAPDATHTDVSAGFGQAFASSVAPALSSRQPRAKRRRISRSKDMGRSDILDPRVFLASATNANEMTSLSEKMQHEDWEAYDPIKGDFSHIVVDSENQKMDIELAVLLQRRKSMSPAPFIVQTDWLTHSLETPNQPVGERLFDYQVAGEALASSLPNGDDRSDMMNSFRSLEKRLRIPLLRVLAPSSSPSFSTSTMSDSSDQPLQGVSVVVGPSVQPVNLIKYLVEHAGGDLVSVSSLQKAKPAVVASGGTGSLPVLVLPSQRTNSGAVAKQQRLFIVGTPTDVADFQQLRKFGAQEMHTLESLLRTALTSTLSLDDSPISLTRPIAKTSSSEAAAVAVHAPAPSPQLSAYERARLEQIRENEAELRRLGINTASLRGGPSAGQIAARKRREQKKKREEEQRQQAEEERKRQQERDEEERNAPFIVVRLSGVMHADEKHALEEISRQMFGTNRLRFSNSISFAHHLFLLRDMLRTNKGLDTALVFVLDEFDAFAARKKQMLLYTLLDLQQSGEVKMIVIGLTDRLDVTESLEKRVRSRFSHRQIYVPPLSLQDLLAVMSSQVQITDSDVAKQACLRDIQVEWNRKTAGLFASRDVKGLIGRYQRLGHSTRWFLRVLIDALTRLLSPSRKNSGVRSPVFGYQELNLALGAASATTDRAANLFRGLTATELFLVVSMGSLEKKGNINSYNFHMAHGEFLDMMSLEEDSGAASGMQYRYDKRVFYKAFEHLVMLGLVRPVGQHAQTRFLSRASILASRDASPSDCIVGDQAVRLVIPRRQAKDIIRDMAGTARLPAMLSQWANKWI